MADPLSAWRTAVWIPVFNGAYSSDLTIVFAADDAMNLISVVLSAT